MPADWVRRHRRLLRLGSRLISLTFIAGSLLARPVPSTARAPDAPARPAPVLAATQPAAAAAYQLRVDLDYAHHAIRVAETLHATNRSHDRWDGLVLHAPPARLPGAFTLERLSITGVAPAYTFDRATLTYDVTLAAPLEPGMTVVLELDYTLKAPRTWYGDWFPDGIVGYNDRLIQFGNWYPVLVPYHDGQGWYTWRWAEVGDPYVSEVADYDLEVHAPAEVIVVSGGIPQQEPGVWRYQLEGARGIAFAASPEYRLAQGYAGGIPIYAYYLPGHERAGAEVLNTAQRAVMLFSRLYGPYPYPSLTIAEDAFLGSMEYTAFVLHGGAQYVAFNGRMDSVLVTLTAHETAHEWWYSLVGNDQAREPWLDESLATYSELAFYRAYDPAGETWFWNQWVRPGAPGLLDHSIYDYTTSAGYLHQVYPRGVTFMSDMHDTMGDDAFYGFLRAWRAQEANRIATAGEFFALHAQYDPGDHCARSMDEFFAHP
jgi:hypothetical protein